VNNAVCTALGKITFAPAGDVKGAAKIKHGADVYPFTKTIKNLVPGSNHFTVLSKAIAYWMNWILRLDRINANWLVSQTHSRPTAMA
jgi:hypothetical protein